ncbi:sterol desaturase family protein [Sporobolomyces koalae]|uniref:sterol desaturase family protein n=1 Tax=Sporobolomyces koalae TaxID=500713 RepID=UPI00317A3172
MSDHERVPIQRRPSSGSLTSESSSPSLETPVSYATDPDRQNETSDVRTTRQLIDRRPPSTFYLKKKSEMTIAEWLCDLATCPAIMHQLVDEKIDRGAVPIHPMWKEHAFILRRALVPLAIQQAAYWLLPNHKWPLALAYPLYWFFFLHFALQTVKHLNHYCVEYGTFDEKQIGRDRTPDKSVPHLAIGITVYMFVRTAIAFTLHYNKHDQPLLTVGWNFPFKLALWEIVLDYFFYCYHRLTHENDYLWSIHSHHHTTKHPTPILSILAEDKQELLEVFLIPALTSWLVPMSFSELYITMCYTLYVEMLGHSGIRAYWPHPVLGWILKPLKMDLAVEDHDLHHRFGKSGRNYGKQTRIYDRIFGTCADRIETYGF